jgi:type I restriction enzyme, S subunit
MSKWQTISLRDLLHQRQEACDVVDPSQETYVTVRLYGRGAVRREIADGKEPVMRSGYRLNAGDLVYSRIDARNGAFAIVPPGLAGAVVSKDFPTFAIRNDRILPSFLIRFLGTEQFYGQLRASSFGTTNRQRINEHVLLSYEIPLPPLSKQEQMVSILDETEDLLRLRSEAVTKCSDDLIPAVFHHFFAATPALGHWPRMKVKDAVRLINGRAFGPGDWGQEGLPIIRIQNLKDPEAPFNYFSGNLDPKFIVNPGTILVSWAGQLVSFGVYVWEGTQAAVNQHIFKVEPKVEFASTYLRYALSDVVHRAKASFQGNEMKHLTKSTLDEAELIYPPLALQQEFSTRIAELSALQILQGNSSRRLEALRASLLDRAFSGEL